MYYIYIGFSLGTVFGFVLRALLQPGLDAHTQAALAYFEEYHPSQKDRS